MRFFLFLLFDQSFDSTGNAIDRNNDNEDSGRCDNGKKPRLIKFRDAEGVVDKEEPVVLKHCCAKLCPKGDEDEKDLCLPDVFPSEAGL